IENELLNRVMIRLQINERMRGEKAEEAIRDYMERGDFERWIRESVREAEIAKEVENLSLSIEKQKYDADVLRERICEIISK
ncbi:unnamed protein product, partial [marine sediment metagenome]